MAEGGTFQERDAAASNQLSVCQEVLNFHLHIDDDDGDDGEWHRVDTWRARCEFLSTFLRCAGVTAEC